MTQSTSFQLVSVAALFPALYLVTGFYYETNDDGQMELLFRHIFASDTVDLAFWHKSTSNLYQWLYSIAPEIPWLGLVVTGMALIAFVVVFSVLRDFLPVPEGLRPWTIWTVALLLSTAILFEHLQMFSYTRSAVLLAGASILLIVHEYLRPGHYSQWKLAASTLMFLLALLTRPEAAWFAFIILSPFLVFIASSRPLVEAFARLRWYVFAISVLLALQIVDTSTIDPDLRSRKELFQTIVDFGTKKPDRSLPEGAFELRNALLGWIFWDKNMNMDDVRKIGATDLTQKTVDASGVRKAVLVLGRSFARNHPVSLFLGVAAVVMVMFNSSLGRSRRLFYLTSHVLFWVFLIYLFVKMKTPHRIISPAIVLYTMANLMIASSIGFSIRASGLFKVMAVLLVAVTVLYASRITRKTAFLESRRLANESQFESLATDSASTIVFGSVSTMNLLIGLDPLRPAPVHESKRYLMLAGWPTWYDFQNRHLIHVLGTDNFPGVMKSISDRSADVVFLSDETFNRQLQEYAKVRYGLSVRFEVGDSSFAYSDPTYNKSINRYRVLCNEEQ